MPCKEGGLLEVRERKEGEKGPGRRGATEATWGPVNRLVLNSNNVGNSKHFSRSKRKPHRRGSVGSLGLTGGRWGGWRRTHGYRKQPTSTGHSLVGSCSSGQGHGPRDDKQNALSFVFYVCVCTSGIASAYREYFSSYFLLSHSTLTHNKRRHTSCLCERPVSSTVM